MSDETPTPTPAALEAAVDFLWPLYADKSVPRKQFAESNIQCQRLAVVFDRYAPRATPEQIEALKRTIERYEHNSRNSDGAAHLAWDSEVEHMRSILELLK